MAEVGATLLKPGLRLQSTVCATEVIVVKAPNVAVNVGCGGRQMALYGEGNDGQSRGAVLEGEGTRVGKRYASEVIGIELLCTKAGAGALTVDGVLLDLKGPTLLPSSD